MRTSIPVIFTRIKRRVENNKHLNDKSKLIVLHILKKVFNGIPKEDLIIEEDTSGETTETNSKENLDSLNPFGDMFGDIFRGKK